METPSTRLVLASEISSLPCQAAAELTPLRAGRPLLQAAVQPQTPNPSTPDLCWDDTPIVSSILNTPEDESDSEDDAALPLSPTVARVHRARLRRPTPIPFHLSSPPTIDSIVKSNSLAYFDPTVLTKEFVSIDNSNATPLDTVEDENKLEDTHDSFLSDTQFSMPQQGHASSCRCILGGHNDDALKIEGKDPVLQPEVREDPHKVPSTPSQCDTPTTSDTAKPNDNVEPQCESAVSALADWLATLTTQSDPDTENVEPLDGSTDADGFLAVAVSWVPSATLLQLLPVDVMARLRCSPMRCVANTVRGPKTGRCRNDNAAKLTKEHVDELLEGIRTLPSLLEIHDIMRIVQDLGTRAFCQIKHLEPAQKEFSELGSDADLRDAETRCATTADSKIDTPNPHSALQAWAQSRLKSPMCNQSMVEGESPENNNESRIGPKDKDDQTSGDLSRAKRKKVEATIFTREVSSDRATLFTREVNWDRLQRKMIDRPRPESLVALRETEFSPDTRSTHLHMDFRPYCPKAHMKKSASQRIREVLEEPLGPKKEGYIYIYWHPGSFGYVKIGRSNNIKRRLREWRQRCHVEVEQVINSGEELQFKVLYVGRIEKLIHAELKEYQMEEPKCRGCDGKHREWFHVSPNLALKVVQKWVKLQPYEGGVLNQSLTETEIDEMCEVTPSEEAVDRKIKRRPQTPLATKRSRRSSARVELVDEHVTSGEDVTNHISKWRFPPLPDYSSPALPLPLFDDKASLPIPTVALLTDPIVS
ncbi:uncharacterized protein A1O9_11981 [Exophiala aquamarina CBS 119918]|uniref:Bacteriophage T5 Orf172 DNA-binding domain-containing protein n=1 Tax=Exophiala aquamarina CBS 119918 TaxID=1182545 RepID=A0A072NWJ2_9EURO|nr:uncharacterized protein A1O9_11981 [Exophiala aquamarina CBS 119918]KEF51991.1 hypothetical protein A1O9_11981 [Exophiala aquamarina CBS 119918]